MNSIIINSREFDFDIGCKLLKVKYKECPFPEIIDIWNDIIPAEFKDVALISNVELRRVAIEILDITKVIDELDATLINKGSINRKNKWKIDKNEYLEYFVTENYSLYKLSDSAVLTLGLWIWQSYYFLKFKDTSTDREYILWVDNIQNDAIASIANTFKTKVKENCIDKIVRQGDCMRIKINKPIDESLLSFERGLTKDEYINLVVNES